MTLAQIAGLPIQRVKEKTAKINMLIYGESGAGKTRLSGSADDVPEMRRVLFIDVEGGILTLRDTFPEVESIRVRSWEEMQSVYDELYKNLHDFTTIVIDSLTEVQKMSMDKVMRKLVEEYGDDANEVPQIREWNINIEQTRKFVRAFRDLPVNTIFTALVSVEKNPHKGTIRRKPSLSGKVKDEVSGFLDVVSYLYIKEVDGNVRRMLQCGQTEETVAKDRTNNLPLVVEDPDMFSIWNLLNVKKGELADGPQGQLQQR